VTAPKELLPEQEHGSHAFLRRWLALRASFHSHAANPPTVGATLVFLAAFVAAWVVALAWDSTGGGLRVQAVIAAITWLLLAAFIRCAPPDLRVPAVAMVVVASGCECLGSLLCGVYRYRYHNLPMYVPPGHGLFYLAAFRVAALPLLQRNRRAVVATVAVASTCWTVHGMLTGDLEGGLWWLILAYFLWRGRDPLLFAVTFVLTMSLEFYGTAVGTWHWMPIMPYTGIAAGNPPSAAGAGYCVLDYLAMQLALVAGPVAARFSGSVVARVQAVLSRPDPLGLPTIHPAREEGHLVSAMTSTKDSMAGGRCGGRSSS
jgi:hypothetical protein